MGYWEAGSNIIPTLYSCCGCYKGVGGKDAGGLYETLNVDDELDSNNIQLA